MTRHVKFCPYCGSGRVRRLSYGMIVCDACRMKFLIGMSRQMRAAPRKGETK
jgi:ribosomal protein L37AE/L43A